MLFQSLSQYTSKLDTVLAAVQGTAFDPCADNTELSKLSGLFQYHWHRLLMVHTGVTIEELRKYYRLLKAKEWLAEGGKSIQEVAKRCGYTDSNTFCLDFERQLSVSPTSSPLSALQAKMLKPKDFSDQCVRGVEVGYQKGVAVSVLPVCDGYDKMPSYFGKLWQLQEAYISQPVRMFAAYAHDPYIRYHGAQHPSYAVCVGTCASAKSQDGSTVQFETMLEGDYITYLHQGSYQTLEESYKKLYLAAYYSKEWQVRDAPVMDEYLNQLGTGVEEKDLQTRLYLPVKPRGLL